MIETGNELASSTALETLVQQISPSLKTLQIGGLAQTCSQLTWRLTQLAIDLNSSDTPAALMQVSFEAFGKAAHG